MVLFVARGSLHTSCIWSSSITSVLANTRWIHLFYAKIFQYKKSPLDLRYSEFYVCLKRNNPKSDPRKCLSYQEIFFSGKFYKYIIATWKFWSRLAAFRTEIFCGFGEIHHIFSNESLNTALQTSLLKPPWHRSHLQAQKKPHKILAIGTSPHMTAFCQPSSSCWSLLTSRTDVQCDVLWPLYMEAGLSQDAWLLSWLLITTFRRGNCIRKALHAVTTYFNYTEAEKHRNLWPENSLVRKLSPLSIA